MACSFDSRDEFLVQLTSREHGWHMGPARLLDLPRRPSNYTARTPHLLLLEQITTPIVPAPDRSPGLDDLFAPGHITDGTERFKKEKPCSTGVAKTWRLAPPAALAETPETSWRSWQTQPGIRWRTRSARQIRRLIGQNRGSGG